jgi:chromosome segregation ATPase
MTKEEKVKKIITAVTSGLKSDLCKDGYPESQIDELHSMLTTALCDIINETSPETSSLKAEVESLKSQLAKAEEEKRELLDILTDCELEITNHESGHKKQFQELHTKILNAIKKP